MIIVLIKKHKGDCRRIRNAASVAPIGPPISFRQKDPSFWQVLSEIRHHLRRILKTLATGQGTPRRRGAIDGLPSPPTEVFLNSRHERGNSMSNQGLT